MQISLRLSALFGFALVLLTGLSSWLIVRRHENRLAQANEHLEATVGRRTRALTRTQEAVIFGLARLADSRDEERGQHL